MVEKNQTEVTIHDIDVLALTLLVDFSYTGEIVITEDNVQVNKDNNNINNNNNNQMIIFDKLRKLWSRHSTHELKFEGSNPVISNARAMPRWIAGIWLIS